MKKFIDIFIIGKGRVAKRCQEIASIFFKKDVTLLNFKDKKEADDFFLKAKDYLIISANNFYIFKQKTTQNNLVINYHNALLPNHRGVNAHIWAIYENDQKAGITWHIVDSGIDTGDIILQEAITLNDNITAKELLLMQQKISIESFDKCLNILVNKPSEIIKQNNCKSSTHKKYELPNCGICNLAWSKEKISSFLRSMDVGAFREIPFPKINILGNWYDIVFYELESYFIKLTLNNNKNITIQI